MASGTKFGQRYMRHVALHPQVTCAHTQAATCADTRARRRQVSPVGDAMAATGARVGSRRRQVAAAMLLLVLVSASSRAAAGSEEGASRAAAADLEELSLLLENPGVGTVVLPARLSSPPVGRRAVTVARRVTLLAGPGGTLWDQGRSGDPSISVAEGGHLVVEGVSFTNCAAGLPAQSDCRFGALEPGVVRPDGGLVELVNTQTICATDETVRYPPPPPPPPPNTHTHTQHAKSANNSALSKKRTPQTFLFSGRGPCQELIGSIVWAHNKLKLAPAIPSIPCAFSITQDWRQNSKRHTHTHTHTHTRTQPNYPTQPTGRHQHVLTWWVPSCHRSPSRRLSSPA